MRHPALLLVALLALACPPTEKDDSAPPEGDSDTDSDMDTDTDTDSDTDADTDTDADSDTDVDGDWTAGPELPDCAAQAGDGDLVALVGVLLAPGGPVAGSVVYSRDSGLIVCAGEDCDSSGAEVICTEGVISPGLIDPHNHLQYNALGVWQHDELFGTRYDWQSDSGYWAYGDVLDEIDDYDCEIVKWAELRELVSGTTSALGVYGGSCIDVLVRNLDEDSSSHGISGYQAYYSSSEVTGRFDEDDGESYQGYLDSGYYEAVVTHVAEGVDGSVSDEIDHMTRVGMSGPGFAFVHSSDATTGQLAQLAAEGTGIIWSPRSNLDLFMDTTPIVVAWRIGVPVALSPDWTWSGSPNPVKELSCAWDYLGSRGAGVSDVELWSMATSDAARAMGLDGVLGVLAEGTLADIAVYRFTEQPYRSVIKAPAEDVWLTVIDGDALFGKPELLEPITAEPDWCETVSACGEDRTVCVQAADSGDDAQTWEEIETLLTAALAEVSVSSSLEYATELYPAFACEGVDLRDSCDLSKPADGDEDGDDKYNICIRI